MRIHAPLANFRSARKARLAAPALTAALALATSAAEAETASKASAKGLAIVEQAGVGSEHSYARAGVLELGGFGNVSIADSYTSVGCSPTLGWFILDGLEISVITSVNFIRQETVTFNASGAKVIEDADTLVLLFLAEPSYHFRLTPVMWGFAGVGVGLADQNPGAGTGFAVAPRFGINVMIGRSGIFTPAMMAVYQTTEAGEDNQGSSGVSGTFGLTAGFTVMW
jgi:hypothetical protein